jgi:hypothetical protein
MTMYQTTVIGIGTADWRWTVTGNADFEENVDIAYEEWNSTDRAWKVKQKIDGVPAKVLKLLADHSLNIADMAKLEIKA